MQVQPCGKQKVSLKHMAGDGTVQHVELAFPGDEELFWAWGLTFKQVNLLYLQWLNCDSCGLGWCHLLFSDPVSFKLGKKGWRVWATASFLKQ